jgi:hypothetical protein
LAAVAGTAGAAGISKQQEPHCEVDDCLESVLIRQTRHLLPRRPQVLQPRGHWGRFSPTEKLGRSRTFGLTNCTACESRSGATMGSGLSQLSSSRRALKAAYTRHALVIERDGIGHSGRT